MNANINDIQNALHDDKCGGGEDDNNLFSSIANDWSDAICGGCDNYSQCKAICSEFRAIINKEIAKRG